MKEKAKISDDRCTRCGRVASETDKFCAECGLFLRDAHIDQRLLLALVHEREGRSEEARHELQRLLQAEPDHLLGNFYFHQGTMDLAIERYEKALAAAPSFVLGYYDLGVAWYHRGNMLEAARAFLRCLEIDPDYRAAHYRLALALFHSGMLEEAREHFEQSLVLTPEYLMAHYHLGVIHERQGDVEKAALEFERSCEESIGEVSSLYHLAMIRRAQNDEAGANELLRRAREFRQTQKAVS
jgi:tetratricopeptide (TPR) repeat protein